MNEFEARELAKKHWDFIEPLLRNTSVPEQTIKLIAYLYQEAFVHGAKHEREG